MAAMANPELVRLAQQLPPKLLRFFARYPPEALSNGALNQTSNAVPSATPAPPRPDANAALEGTGTQSDTVPTYENPFRSTRHPVTGKWHDPVYSLRWQADFVKMARKHGVEELLPYTTKGTEVRISKRQEHGLRVKGTGVGQRVKGHWRERTLKGRLEERRQAMVKMPEMINDWKMKGHGRGIKKWPK